MRNYLLLAGSLAAAAALAPPTAHAEVQLRTENGFLYDIEDTGASAAGGQLGAGTEASGRFPYAGAYFLAVNRLGRPARCYDTGNRAALRTLGGREAQLAEYRVEGTDVFASRRIYVPNEGGEYARYLEVFRNDGVAAVTIAVSIVGDLGDPGAERVLTSDMSLNDPTLTRRFRNDVDGTSDTWVMVDDRDTQGIPTLVHVMQGWDAGSAEGTVKADCVSISPYDATSDRCDGAAPDPCGAGDGQTGFRYDFELEIPAGETRSLLHFAIQSSSRENATREADRIQNLPDDVLVGIPDELLPTIVNFKVTGLPRIQLTHPVSVEEGEPIVVEAMVSDPEGDPVSWSWDLPGLGDDGDTDGTFGEEPGATRVTIPAEVTNGRYDWKIRIRAVEDGDPTSVRTRVAVVDVLNVPPTISSVPPTPRLAVGDYYRYEVDVSDAPGEGASIGYVLRLAPDGMTRSADGVVEWTVQESQRGETHPVVLEVSDDTGDRASQSWELRVVDNLRPDPPTPESPVEFDRITDRQPVLRVANASDVEGDPLRYLFRIDTNVTAFAEGRTPLYASPFIPEGAGGFTEWQVPMRLEPGTYFWEVKVKDDLPDEADELESLARYGAFNVFEERPPDGGMPPMRFDPTADDGGCRVGPVAGAPGVLWPLALAGLVVAARRRRRA